MHHKKSKLSIDSVSHVAFHPTEPTIFAYADAFSAHLVRLRPLEEPSSDTGYTIEKLSSFTVGLPTTFLTLSTCSVLGVASTNNSVTLIHPDSSIKVLGGTSGHKDYINSISITESPVRPNSSNSDQAVACMLGADQKYSFVATISDDKTLIVWTNGIPTAYPLVSRGMSVEFMGRHILVAEEAAVRVLDWETGHWTVSWYFDSRVLWAGWTMNEKVVVSHTCGWEIVGEEEVGPSTGYTSVSKKGGICINGAIGFIDNGRQVSTCLSGDTQTSSWNSEGKKVAIVCDGNIVIVDV